MDLVATTVPFITLGQQLTVTVLALLQLWVHICAACNRFLLHVLLQLVVIEPQRGVLCDFSSEMGRLMYLAPSMSRHAAVGYHPKSG